MLPAVFCPTTKNKFMNDKELKLECLKIVIQLGFNTYDLAIQKANELFEFLSK